MAATEKKNQLPPDTGKLQKSRISEAGSLEEFKRAREQQIKGLKNDTGDGEFADEIKDTPKPDSAEMATPVPVNTDAETPVQTDHQTALGLDEPPESLLVAEPANDWGNLPTETELKQWWEEFNLTQPVRISSFLRTIVPRMDKNEVVVVVPPSRVEMLEPVKFPFNRFIREISDGRLLRLRVEAGEVEMIERKPYTEKEKLEYLQKLHPELKEVLEKLDLRLP